MKGKRRWGIRLGALFCALCAGSLIAFRVLVQPRLIEALVDGVAQKTGVHLDPERIRLHPFSSIESQPLRSLSCDDSGPVESVSADRLAIHYNPFSLIHGLPVFLSNLSVEVQGLRLSLDLSMRQSPETKTKGEMSQWMSPLWFKEITLQEAEIDLKASEGFASFRGLSMETKRQAPGSGSLRVRADTWQWQHPLLRGGESTLAASLIFSPDRVSIERLEVGGTSIVRQAALPFPMTMDDLPFELDLNVASGSLKAEGRLQENVLDCTWSGQGLDLSRLTGVASEGFPTLLGSLNIEGKGRVPLKDLAKIEGTVQAEIRDIAFQGTFLDAVRVRARVEQGRLFLDEVHVSGSGSEVALQSIEAPWQAVVDENMGRLLSEMSGSFEMKSSDVPGLIRLVQWDLPLPESPIPDHRLSLSGHVGGGDLVISQGELISGEDQILLEALQVPFSALNEQSQLQARLKIHWPHLDRISTVLCGPAISGSLSGDVVLSGSVAEAQGHAQLSGEDLVYQDLALGDLRVQGSIERGILDVEDFTLDRGDVRLTGHGRYQIRGKRIDALKVVCQQATLGPLLQEFLRQQMCWRGQPVDLDGSLSGTLEVSGPLEALNRMEGSVDLALDHARMNGTDLGDGVLRAEKRAGVLVLHEARLTQGQDHLTVKGDLALDSGRLGFCTIEARLNEIEPYARTFFGPRPSPVAEGLDFSLQVQGDLEDPQFSGEARVSRAREGRFEISDLFCRAKGSLRHIEVESLTGQSVLGAFQISGQVQMPKDPEHPSRLRPGAVSVEGRIDIPDLGLLRTFMREPLVDSGSARLECAIRGDWKDAEVSLSLSAHEMVPSIQGLPEGPFSLSLAAVLKDRDLELQSLSLTNPQVSLEGKGRWTGWPDLEQWMSGHAVLKGGDVRFNASLDVPDLKWIGGKVDAIKRLEGRLSARLDAKGSWPSPEIEGSLELKDGALRTALELPTLEAVSLEAGLRRDQVILRSLEGEFGGSPFQMTGSVDISDLRQPVVKMALTGKDLLVFRDENTSVRADTALDLVGPLSGLKLGGKLTLTEGQVVSRLRILDALMNPGAPKADAGIRLFSWSEPPLRDLAFDVHIVSRNPFRIRSNVLRADVRPDLSLQGTGRLPSLVGDIYVDPSTLYMPSGRVFIESGAVRFLKSNPGTPEFNLKGRARMYGYDISLLIEGPYDAPEVTVSSVPALSNDDILLMLFTGKPPSKTLAGSPEGKAGSKVAVYVGRDVLSQWLEERAPRLEETFLERLDLTMGGDVTRSGDETLDARFLLKENVLGKAGEIHITGEKDVYDHYNAGLRLMFKFE